MFADPPGGLPRRPAAATQAGLAGSIPLPVLTGARIRESIRVFVGISIDGMWAVVTYSHIILVERENAHQRVEITTFTRVAHDHTRGDSVQAAAVEVLTSGRNGQQAVPKTSKMITRLSAKLDLKIFDAYVAKLIAFRTSKENATHEFLPTVQARNLDKDLSAATGAGITPITMGGALGATGKMLLPKVVQKTNVVARWSAMRLSKLLDKKLNAEKVLGSVTKMGQTAGVPKSVEAAQSKWGSQYIDPVNRPLVLYTDFRESGQSIYGHDVSPEWVKQGYHWLYVLTIEPLRKIFSVGK